MIANFDRTIMYKTFHAVFLLQTTHQAVDTLVDVIPCLETYLRRYNDEFTTNPLNLMLSNHVISHVVRIHRILSIKNR